MKKNQVPGVLSAAHFPDASEGSHDSFAAYRIASGDVLEFIFKQGADKEKTFTLTPLDTVQVNFLSNPEWNTQQRIRPNGAVSLPYQPEVALAGLTVPQATRKLEGLYTPILKDPRVFLSLNEFQSRQEALRASLYSPSTGYTRLISVQADGSVSLPFVGLLQARDVPLVRFREQVKEQYKLHHGMDVDVVLNKSAGQQVYLVGMLHQPGVYAMNGPTNALQAISMAHGFRDDAQLGQVILVRRKGNTMVCRQLDVSATLEGAGSDGLVAVQSGDILFVPRTRLASAAEVAMQLSAISFFRGINMSWTWQMTNNDGDVVVF